MKLGIMQPYFFPYAQQFRHIAQCEQWLVFDTVKFSRKTWATRNRVANLQTEFSYISVPIEKGATNGTITEAQIVQSEWQTDLFNKLRSYEAVSPHYRETIQVIEHCLPKKFDTLGALNTKIISQLCSVLKIQTKIERLSKMNFDLPAQAQPGEWALIISKKAGATVYSNAPGGRHLFDESIYKKNGIELEFYESIPLTYQTKKLNFVSDLSVIDSLMWIGVEGLTRFVHS